MLERRVSNSHSISCNHNLPVDISLDNWPCSLRTIKLESDTFSKDCIIREASWKEKVVKGEDLICDLEDEQKSTKETVASIMEGNFVFNAWSGWRSKKYNKIF